MARYEAVKFDMNQEKYRKEDKKRLMEMKKSKSLSPKDYGMILNRKNNK